MSQPTTTPADAIRTATERAAAARDGARAAAAKLAAERAPGVAEDEEFGQRAPDTTIRS